MTTALATVFSPPQIEGANFLNLMIVDDERAVREVCREVAQSLGFNTVAADSAEHAYRQLESQGIDVVLLDLKLPGSGWPGGAASDSGAPPRCCRHCGDRLWHRPFGGASHEEWRLRLHD